MKLPIKKIAVAGFEWAVGLCFSFSALGQIPQKQDFLDTGKYRNFLNMESGMKTGSRQMPDSDLWRRVFFLDDITRVEAAIGGLTYEKLGDKGTRFYLRNGAGLSAGHAWHFEPADFRRKIIRIYYSGLPPRKIIFKLFRSDTGRKFLKEKYAEISSGTKVIELKVPDEYPFRDVSNFVMQIKFEATDRPFADFYIERIEVL